MEKYWFTVRPDVFVWKKNNRVYVYNTLNFQNFQMESSAVFDSLYETLQNPEHLYTVELNAEALQDDIVLRMMETDCASLTPQQEGVEVPVSYYPMVGVQRDRNKLNGKKEMQQAENYLHYLQELTVYVNGTGLCDNLTARQHPYILEQGNELDFDKLSVWLNAVAHSAVTKIHVCGANVFEYTRWGELLNVLDRLHTQKCFYVSCNQLVDFYRENRLKLSEQFSFSVIIDKRHPFDKGVVEVVSRHSLSVKWLFYLSDEKDCLQAQELMENYGLESCQLKPVYTGNNQEFFKENVYLTEEDVKSTRLNKRQIFANQVLNTNDFGKLVVSPQGNVYVNVNFPPCGSVDDSVYDLLEAEFLHGNQWFRTRSEEPCAGCLYQWICPSLSNYEWVLEENHLCFKE